MNKKKVLTVVLTALFAALSVVSILVLQVPLIPSAPFLKYDMADIFIIICTLTAGIIPGTTALLVTCLIQAFLLGGDGWIGFLMHFIASEAMVLIFGTVCRKAKTLPRLVISAVASTIATTALMIPLNLVFTGIFLGATVAGVAAMLLPAIIPFNLLKAGINCTAAVILYLAVSPLLKKIRD